MTRRWIVLAASALALACSVRHPLPANAVFRIESRDGALHLVSPSPAGEAAGFTVPFSQILASRYGYNPWEQFVDLSPGMRLMVVTMTGKTETTSSYYEIVNAGRHGFRIENRAAGTGRLDKRANYGRLFYQTKFLASPGQPMRAAVCLWSESREELGVRTAEARENPGFACDGKARDCLAFPDRTTVSAEIEVVVNQQPRYVLLGSTVRDLLRADRLSQDADLHVRRRYHNALVPVTWPEKAFVQSLPLVGGDEISW